MSLTPAGRPAGPAVGREIGGDHRKLAITNEHGFRGMVAAKRALVSTGELHAHSRNREVAESRTSMRQHPTPNSTASSSVGIRDWVRSRIPVGPSTDPPASR